ncbi:enoyl-CoA hydratase/isomerase family protein [Actinopolymorpha singaporensis]|uniref:enoyl-CoA hydratase n=1 Tax=Actinopolymorpha singaporensis TaxID=117157 RepID=A0A1H1SQV0_9ACTN|nr:enoyl-CoA hydratase-related protein [Actinopolymorpha singaporensis]SDS50387.1 Enoyl-CoA hydratase/carnithine racemase [Actinopolymorpha singaporensis]
MSSTSKGVQVRRVDEAGQVAELSLDRPEALNAVSTAQAEAITRAATSLAADRRVRAVVLSSACEKAFCVGADLKERNTFDDEDLWRQRPVIRRLFGSVLDLPMPVIAAVHRYALGGGFELALSCDLIVADETAVFGLPEVSVGLVPGGGGTQLLARRVGWSRAGDLILTGRRVDAAEADRLGVVDRLVPAGRARQTAVDLATQIAANSPVGVRQAKQALRLGADSDLAAGLAIEDAAWRATAFSPDRKEGIAAFNEKRPPVWPGE